MESTSHSIKVEGEHVFVDGVLMAPDKIKISIHFATPQYAVEFDLKDNPISFEGTFTVTGELS
jgi:hypothetical protein